MAAAHVLLHFCEIGNLPAIQKFFAQTSNFDLQDEDGHTGLQVACANNQIEVIKYLLNQNVDINSSNVHGWTALHHASFHGHFEVVKLLIRRKALVTKPTYFGATPLNVAVSNGHFNIVKLLAKEGALIHEKNHLPELCPNPLINTILHHTLGQKSTFYPKIHILKIPFFFYKIHICKIPIFTKFTSLKCQFSQNSHF